MKILTRRKPVNWGAFIAGMVFAALFCLATITDIAFVPGGRHSHSKIIRRSVDPKGFVSCLRSFAVVSVVFVTLASIRVVPFEDALKRFGEQTNTYIKKRGYDTKPAPMWTYFLFCGFIGGLIWLVWYIGFCT